MKRNVDMSTTLGAKLADIIRKQEDEKRQKEREKIEAAVRKKQRERNQVENFLDDLLNNIQEDIFLNNKVPSIKIDNYDTMKFLDAARDKRTEYQDLWNKFIRNLQQNGLSLLINYDHDGMGMKDWRIVTVKPL